LPLRVDVAGDPTFGELLERVRRVTLDASRMGTRPRRLVNALLVPRDPTRRPLVEVSLHMVDIAEDEWRLPGIAMEVMDMPRRRARTAAR
jgi:hypothetical protein